MDSLTKEKNLVFGNHFFIGILFFSFYLLGEFSQIIGGLHIQLILSMME